MTQPALSQLIRDLEAKLGFRVVERTTRKVLLTDPGRSFLADAESILLHLDRAVENARAAAGQASNSLRIGAILPMAFAFLPSVLSKLRQRHQDAEIHIEYRPSQELVTAVETGALHVAVLRPPRRAATLQIETLRLESFVLALRADHPLAKRKTLRLADLRAENLVRISRDDLRDSFDALDRELVAAGLGVERIQTADSTLTALALVSTGAGISFVPSWAAELPWKEVQFREIAELTTRIELAVAWEATNLPPLAQHFIDIARKEAG